MPAQTPRTASRNYRRYDWAASSGSVDTQGRIITRVITRVKMIKGLGRKPPPNRTFTFSYAYDANGAVTAITYPSGHVVDYTSLH